MDVLIAGGTGFIGRNLADALVERGHNVTALARTPSEGALPEGVETALGDVTAYDSIESAFAGRDAVVNLVSLSPLFEPKGGNEMHFKIHRDGTENCVHAAEEHDVDRFVQMSGLGADPAGPTHFLRAKGQAETLVRASSLDWTIVRPSVVFGEGDEFVGFTRTFTPPVLAPLPGGGKTRFQPIYVGDLVAILAAIVTEDGHGHETYEIGGPEVLTLAEVGKLARKARGQSVHVIPVPMPLVGVGMRVGSLIPGVPFGPDQYRSLQVDNTTDENDLDAFGVDEADLTTLAAYLGVEDK